MKENVVYLFVGPRAAGKSTYARTLTKLHPDFLLVSRDAILVELLGSEHTDSYSGAIHYVMENLTNRLREALAKKTGKTILLDCWTGDSQERRSLIGKLRSYGAEKVIALFFTTPVNFVEEWFWNKPGIAKSSEMRGNMGKGLVFFGEDAPSRDFALFHKFAKNISDDGFNQIVQVNPLEDPILLP